MENVTSFNAKQLKVVPLLTVDQTNVSKWFLTCFCTVFNEIPFPDVGLPLIVNNCFTRKKNQRGRGKNCP